VPPRGHDRSYPPVSTVSLRRAAKVPHCDLVRTAWRHRDGSIRRPEPPACSPERPGRQPPARRPCITRRSARRGESLAGRRCPHPGRMRPDPRLRAGLRPSRLGVATGRRLVRPMDLSLGLFAVNLAAYAGPAAAGRPAGVADTAPERGRAGRPGPPALGAERFGQAFSAGPGSPSGKREPPSATSGHRYRQTLSCMAVSSEVCMRVSLAWVKREPVL
jgi:hypothetical protein